MKPQTEDNLRCLAAAITVILFLGLAGSLTGWWTHLPDWLVYLMAFAMIYLVGWMFNHRRKPLPTQVTFDETHVTCSKPDGSKETVQWVDLKEIGIVTTSQGPFVEDLYWVLLGDQGGCAVPNEAIGMAGLLGRLQDLPGFDNRMVIEAMGSTNDASFTCWKRPASP